MKYKKYSLLKFFREINTESKARDLIWRSRFNDKEFECPKCNSSEYGEIESRPEIRQCKSCRHQLGVRAGTIFHRTQLPLLTWVRAIFLMTKSKRGISTLEMQRQLELGRYRTTMAMMNKIRRAFQQRDKEYRIEGIIELDGAQFGKKATGTHAKVLVGVETKRWWTDDGKIKQRAGFAKVFMGDESKEPIEEFMESSIKTGSDLKTDGHYAYVNSPKAAQTYQMTMDSDLEKMKYWLPWVHKFISNAKRWILGTHHGLRSSKYLDLYLAEYTYRFNRRHDLDGLFHRALTACALAKPKTG